MRCHIFSLGINNGDCLCHCRCDLVNIFDCKLISSLSLFLPYLSLFNSFPYLTLSIKLLYMTFITQSMKDNHFCHNTNASFWINEIIILWIFWKEKAIQWNVLSHKTDFSFNFDFHNLFTSEYSKPICKNNFVFIMFLKKLSIKTSKITVWL